MLTQAPVQPAVTRYITPPVMLPSVVNEELIIPFKYWDQTLKQGMRYQEELYDHCHSFSIHDRLTAYTIACEYTEQGIAVCITVSKTQYTIWTSLRSKTPELAQSAVNLLNKSNLNAGSKPPLQSQSHLNQPSP